MVLNCSNILNHFQTVQVRAVTAITSHLVSPEVVRKLGAQLGVKTWFDRSVLARAVTHMESMSEVDPKNILAA